MSYLPLFIYRLSNWIYKIRIPVLPFFLMILNRIIWGAYIPPSCKIGKNTRFGYGGSGIVIHARAEIGNNCILNPGVVIGGRSKIFEVPKIGDNVWIGSGAKILGDIKIGNNVIIGPNAVVIKDIPANSISVGIPSRIIKKGINIQDYV